MTILKKQRLKLGSNKETDVITKTSRKVSKLNIKIKINTSPHKIKTQCTHSTHPKSLSSPRSTKKGTSP